MIVIFACESSFCPFIPKHFILLWRQFFLPFSISFLNLDACTILCRVEDNGIGRKKSLNKNDPFRKKSMAIEFITQRLDILEKATGTKSSFQIIDKENAAGESEGTLIEIVIPKLKK